MRGIRICTETWILNSYKFKVVMRLSNGGILLEFDSKVVSWFYSSKAANPESFDGSREKMEHFIQAIVLYHPSSGQIYLAPRQDPSLLDDDVTQYMQHSPLQPMASSLSCVAFTSIWPLCFHPDLLQSELTTCGHKHPQLNSMKFRYHPSILWPQPDLWHL